MFSYIGGKSRIGNWIKDYIPTDITTYVEPFSGAFWVFFKMDLDKYPDLEKVVYNDFNPVNANLFACLKTPQEFYEYIKDIPCQGKDDDKKGTPCDESFRQRFNEYQRAAFNNKLEFDSDNPNFEWGLNYAYVITQVFSGSKPESSSFIDLKHKYRSKFDTFRDKVGGIKRGKVFQQYLNRITDVENMDFEEVIKKYDSPTTYFYVDPPYFETESYYSNHDFDRSDHERLAKCLKSIEGKFSLSYYDFPLLSEWFPKDEYVWEKKEFAKAASAKAGKTQNMGEELLIMNYNPVVEVVEVVEDNNKLGFVGKSIEIHFNDNILDSDKEYIRESINELGSPFKTATISRDGKNAIFVDLKMSENEFLESGFHKFIDKIQSVIDKPHVIYHESPGNYC